MVIGWLGMADPVTGIRWLPPDNYKSLHEEAIAASGGQITFAHFRRIHLRHFPEYVMLRGKRKEKCDDCMMFFKQLTKTLAPDERRKWERARRYHLEQVREERRRYWARKKMADRSPWILSMVIDGQLLTCHP